MFGKLAHLMYRRRWYVVGAWIVILVAAFSQAVQVGKVLGPGDFTNKGSDSQKASAILDKQFHQNNQKTSLVLIRSNSLSASDPRFKTIVAGTVRKIRGDAALRINSLDNPLVTHNRQLIARDGRGLAILFSSNLKESQIEDQIVHLRSLVHTAGFTTYVVGTPAANYDYALSSKNDLNLGESITVPILLVILLLVFGSLVAALLPLLLAGFAIILSLALVYAFGHALDTSVYVTNVVSILGLGIGIDYTLFIVYRFREELEVAGTDIESAVVRTMQTTGRAVFFSGLTVAIGLSSLILTNLSFMQSMGLGGMVVPFTALLVAMTLLPAVLGLLGTKVNRARVLPRRFLRTGDNGGWHRLATTIMRRPVLMGGAVLIVMLALTLPVKDLAFAFGSLKNAPQVESVKGYLYMKSHFNSVSDPTQVVIQAPPGRTVLDANQVAGMRALEARLGRDPETLHVVGPANFLPAAGRPTLAQQSQLTGRYISADLKNAVIGVVPRHEVGTKGNEDLVRRVRDAVVPFTNGALAGDVIRVGGAQANYNDFNDAMYSKFPFIIVIVLLLTYCFLFFAFRSVFLPLKAVLLNLLSVGASYGMLQLVFQRGIGSSLLGFSPESGVASWVPIFLFAFLFGLSMDYEVFLLSRMRERWLATGHNLESVAFGLEKTGRLITSAALIMIIAFSGFLIGHEIQLKQFGFGMLASIALDATLIRIVLVPSIMEIMGDWNWWLPPFLQSFGSHGATWDKGEVASPIAPDREPVTA